MAKESKEVKVFDHNNPNWSGLSEFAQQLRDDPELAWAWHCNIAMIGIDSGANAKEANERTADFMSRAFGVDTKSYLLLITADNAQ